MSLINNRRKKVIIIGGGYAGTMLAKAIDQMVDVVLIEPREAFFHNVAAIRAMVDPSLLDQIILPYSKLLKQGRLVRDRVQSVKASRVHLISGAVIEGDIIVIATGSQYAQPFKPTTDDASGIGTATHAAHDALVAAKRIAIVGAGPVGIELAGEIATGIKGKSITLVSNISTLFPTFPIGLSQRVEAELKSLGVTVRKGVNAQGLTELRQPTAGPLTLDTGEKFDVDLIIPAMGAKPANELLRPIALLDDRGRVLVDSWLRPNGQANLFALGDVAATGDLMTIVGISRQVPWLVKTIKGLASGKSLEDLPPYTPWVMPPILIPLGSRRGASVLPVTKNGAVVGPFLTSAIKGKALFIPKYRKALGL